MPNYRQKNRNKNKNKNKQRNKPNNQNNNNNNTQKQQQTETPPADQQPQQQQQQQQHEVDINQVATSSSSNNTKARAHATQPQNVKKESPSSQAIVVGNQPSESQAGVIAAPQSPTTTQIPDIVASATTTTKAAPETTSATSSATAGTVASNALTATGTPPGIVSHQTIAHTQQQNKQKEKEDGEAEAEEEANNNNNNNYNYNNEERENVRIESSTEVETHITQQSVLAMGANSTKATHKKTHDGAHKQIADDASTTATTTATTYVANTITTQTTPQGKVIVHRIVRETDDNGDESVAVQQQQVVDHPAAAPQPPENVKVIVHQIILETDHTAGSSNRTQSGDEVDRPETQAGEFTETREPSEIGKHESLAYQVESPKNLADCETDTRRFVNFEQEVQIQELSETSSGEFNVDNPPLISEVDSECETSNDVVTQELANTTRTQHGHLSIEVVTSEETQLLDSASPEEACAEQQPAVSGSTSQAQQVELQQRRAQKRQALESHFLPQMLSPRYLDSILEENSDMSDARSDCSEQPLSRSASGNDGNYAESLEKAKRANAIFPKSQLDFSKRHKHGQLPKLAQPPIAIREEPVALKLEAKLIEQEMAEETCTRLASLLSPTSEEAEVVYINSASSSLSDLLELEPDDNAASEQQQHMTIDLDTDVHDIINKPSGVCERREATPVNQTPTENAEVLNELLNNIEHEHQLLCALADETINTNKEHVKLEQQQQQQQQQQSEDANNSSTNSSDSSSNKIGDSFSLNAVVGESASETGAYSEMDKVRELLNRNNNNNNNNNNINDYNNGELNELLAESTITQLPPHKPAQQPATHSFSLANAQPNDLKQFLKSQNSAPLTRQASNESHCSDSTTHSQCTAIHVPDADEHAERLRDFDNVPISDNITTQPTTSPTAIKKLRLLCTETLASLPYGEDVLEELATVAQNIGEVRAIKSAAAAGAEQQQQHQPSSMPYPIPDLPHINELQLTIAQKQRTEQQQCNNKLRSPTPPPVPAPPNNYQNGQADAWLGIPTETDDKVLVCLSPAQRALGTPNAQQSDALLDAHQKFIERRGYHEFSHDQVDEINRQKLEEQHLMQTTALMKKLRKSLTPSPSPSPPPIPPPPVPERKIANDTNAKEHSTNTQTKTAERKPNAATADRHNRNDELIAENSNANGTTETATTTATTLTKIATTANGEPLQFNNESNFNNNSNSSNSNNNNKNNMNRHRLLEIISDTNTIKNVNETKPASSFENSTAITSAKRHSEKTTTVETATTVRNQCANQSKTTQSTIEAAGIPPSQQQQQQQQQINSESSDSTPSTMQSMQSELARMFPAIGQTDIFDAQRKRFSNIESTGNQKYCQQLLSTLPKRHSHHSETHAFESKQRIENGQLVYDYSTSKHDVKDDTDFDKYNNNNNDNNAKYRSENAATTAQAASDSKTQQIGNEANEIMSALKLNLQKHQQQQQQQQGARNENYDDDATASNQQTTSAKFNGDIGTASGELKKIINSDREISGTYEEFRQRAKAAAAAITAPAAQTTPTKNSAYAVEHEKLFKDFDALKEQLHRELESGKAQREQREKSASLYDLNRIQMQQQKQHFEELKRQRHEHMKELEMEIERSMRSRQIRQMSMPRTDEQASNNKAPYVHHIPIQREQNEERTHEIPIQVEPGYQPAPTSGTATGFDSVDEASRFRRAESMFNLSENGTLPSSRPHTTSSYYNTADDWSRYASDLGSSENIVRPFAREVEICYQRQRPQGIRAPRLSVSTNDLSHSYDTHNAYNVRRTHAPMLQTAPQPTARPHYGSCYSMIERNPNPTYISTTARRGTSPAPQPTTPPTRPLEHELRQRRASLPREIQEQQLKYITSKEEELRMEFERLQNERRRLMDELQNTQEPQVAPPPVQRLVRDSYRAAAPRLPTLSEDEVLRQQMAEEWLNKVAEREERRLQKIIKISKLHEQESRTNSVPTAHVHTTHPTKPDISEEFLTRVKERRHKLAMPADSDWESGAESQPITQPGNASESDEVASVKILEGKTEAKLKEMPAHLREFAKFSNHQVEQIANGQRELHEEEERRKEATDNSVSSAHKKTSIVKTYKTLRQPMPVVPTRRSSHSAVATASNGNAPTVPDNTAEPSMTTTTTTTATTTANASSPETPTSAPPTSGNYASPFERFDAFFGNAMMSTPATADSFFNRKLPATFDEMFAMSPFNRHIHEEFQNFWQTFNTAPPTTPLSTPTTTTNRTSLP